jgi:CMP-N-acetylneuraminic acid synthetase
MAFRGLTTLAVVPARGGSKTIPRKNLCRVGGMSLVARAACMAVAIDWIDRGVLSTDDREIAEEGKRHGLEVPFMRPAELAGDTATSVDMWRHAWLESEKYYGMRFDISLLLEPTSPLRRPGDIEETAAALLEGNYRAAATVSRTPAHYTPHKCLTLSQEGTIGFYLEDGARFSLRQKIPAFYHRNGVCYAVRRETLVERGHILEEDCRAVILDRPLVNIDDPFDLALAEFLLEREEARSGD